MAHRLRRIASVLGLSSSTQGQRSVTFECNRYPSLLLGWYIL